jgi:hypothetical protein
MLKFKAHGVTVNLKVQNVSGHYPLFFTWNQERKQPTCFRIFGLWATIRIVNSVHHLFEITGRLDVSTSIYNFQEKIIAVLHSGIKNKHTAFTFIVFAIFINKMFILASTLLSQVPQIREGYYYCDLYFGSLLKTLLSLFIFFPTLVWHSQCILTEHYCATFINYAKRNMKYF